MMARTQPSLQPVQVSLQPVQVRFPSLQPVQVRFPHAPQWVVDHESKPEHGAAFRRWAARVERCRALSHTPEGGGRAPGRRGANNPRSRSRGAGTIRRCASTRATSTTSTTATATGVPLAPSLPTGGAPPRRGPRLEVKGQGSKVRGLRSEVRGSRSEARGSRSEVRGQTLEVRGQRFEVRGQRFEVRSPFRQRSGG